MITLTYAVIVNYFFGQVTEVSGFSGISGISKYAPDLVGGGSDRTRLYYTALIVAVLVYVLIRFVLKTPFGFALQGIEDDPIRMSSLGYNVPLHRTLAFGLAAFFASLAGILYVWWNGQIDPATVGLQGTIDLLVIAVIGGLARVEGLASASPSSLSGSTCATSRCLCSAGASARSSASSSSPSSSSRQTGMGVWDRPDEACKVAFGRAASEPARSRRRLTLDLESQTSEGHPGGFEDTTRIAKGGVPVKHKIQGQGA